MSVVVICKFMHGHSTDTNETMRLLIATRPQYFTTLRGEDITKGYCDVTHTHTRREKTQLSTTASRHTWCYKKLV